MNTKENKTLYFSYEEAGLNAEKDGLFATERGRQHILFFAY